MQSIACLIAVAILSISEAAAIGLDFPDSLVGAGAATTRSVGWRVDLEELEMPDPLLNLAFASDGTRTLIAQHDAATWRCRTDACPATTLAFNATGPGFAPAAPAMEFEVSASGVGAWVGGDLPQPPQPRQPPGSAILAAFYPAAADLAAPQGGGRSRMADPVLVATAERFASRGASGLSFPFQQPVGGGFDPTVRLTTAAAIPAPGSLSIVATALAGFAAASAWRERPRARRRLRL